jgi:integrase
VRGVDGLQAVVAARKALGGDVSATLLLHDLRHTHAALLLRNGVPVKVVSERLGHAKAMITLGVYAHVTPGTQGEAAAKFGVLLSGGP